MMMTMEMTKTTITVKSKKMESNDYKDKKMKSMKGKDEVQVEECST